MKKQIRTIIIATIITITIIVGCAHAIPVHAENKNPKTSEFYPKLTIVFDTEDNEKYRIVQCIDTSRNIWKFFDNEFKWETGDIANLLMWNCNSQNPYDDKIINVIWEEYNLELCNQIIEWCQ